MGLFSSKKTYVSSVIYNLAGAVEDRPDYLKTTIVGGVFSTSGASIGETLNSSYLGGPGISLRSFGRWAEDSGYNTAIGLSRGDLQADPAIDYGAVESYLTTLYGPLVLQTAETNNAQYMYWATQYMVTNHYALIDTAWSADYFADTNKIRITFASAATVEFTPVNFNKTARYLYASYVPYTGSSTGSVVTGSTITLPTGSPFPSTAGYTLTFDDTITASIVLTTHTHKDIYYSDGRPMETSDTYSDRTEFYTSFNRIYERTVYKGNKPGTNSIWSEKELMVQHEGAYSYTDTAGPTYSEEVIAGGVIKGTYTTVNTQMIGPARSYRIDTQEIIMKTWSGRPYVYIYREGTGNPTFDSFFGDSADQGSFYPFIPFRLDNKFVSGSYLPDIYTKSKKAFKKATRGKYDQMINKIADNASLGDIDYAYLVFGVSLNVANNECRRYIYEFMKANMYGGIDGSTYLNWRTQWYAAQASMDAWINWRSHQEAGMPLFGTPEPTVLPYPTPKTASIYVNSYNQPTMNFDMKITWAGIVESVGSGLLKFGAKTGEVWIEKLGTETFGQYVYGNNGENPTVEYVARTIDHIRIYFQKSQTQWSILDIYGWEHENMIYGGKSILITAGEALDDADESGFVIPIHDRILRDLPLKISTQVATTCNNLVFNCYTVVKQKWYQSGLFKIILVVVIIAVSVFTMGASAGASVGLLGTNAAVGAALGYTGMAAIFAGAIANAVAAMILTQLIMSVSTNLLGPKIGAIIGAIASFVALQVGSALSVGTDFSQALQTMMRPDNLLKLTSSIGNGISQMIQGNIAEITEQTQNLLKDYSEQTKQIGQAFEDNIGYDSGMINPLSFTDTFGFSRESPTSFLSRTLMTGSDIAQLSNDLISGFTQVTLNTDQNF